MGRVYDSTVTRSTIMFEHTVVGEVVVQALPPTYVLHPWAALTSPIAA